MRIVAGFKLNKVSLECILLWLGRSGSFLHCYKEANMIYHHLVGYSLKWLATRVAKSRAFSDRESKSLLKPSSSVLCRMGWPGALLWQPDRCFQPDTAFRGGFSANHKALGESLCSSNAWLFLPGIPQKITVVIILGPQFNLPHLTETLSLKKLLI